MSILSIHLCIHILPSTRLCSKDLSFACNLQEEFLPLCGSQRICLMAASLLISSTRCLRAVESGNDRHILGTILFHLQEYGSMDMGRAYKECYILYLSIWFSLALPPLGLLTLLLSTFCTSQEQHLSTKVHKHICIDCQDKLDHGIFSFEFNHWDQIQQRHQIHLQEYLDVFSLKEIYHGEVLLFLDQLLIFNQVFHKVKLCYLNFKGLLLQYSNLLDTKSIQLLLDLLKVDQMFFGMLTKDFVVLLDLVPVDLMEEVEEVIFEFLQHHHLYLILDFSYFLAWYKF